MKITFVNIILLLVVFVNAQNVDFKKKNFTDVEGFNIAQNELKDGDSKFFAKSYSDAINHYLKANEFNPNNASLNFKLGVSYLKSDTKENSLQYFIKAKQLDPNVDPKLGFALAQSYQINKQFESAINEYKSYLDGLSSAEKSSVETEVAEKIKECENSGGKNAGAISTTEKPVELENTVKETPKKEEIAEIKTPEPFDPEKKPEYVPVNAYPVNTEIEEVKKPVQKTEKPITETKPASKISTTVNTSEQIIYKIQILSSTKKLSEAEKNKLYKGPEKIQIDQINGVYKYLLGNFKTKEEADYFKVKTNFQDSFVVKYLNGKRL